MDLEQPCDSCGGTGKQLSDAVRAALEAATEKRKALGCGSYIHAADLNKIVTAAIGEFVHVTERAQATEAIPPPAVRQTWKYNDSEPGPEVKAVRDREEDVWRREEYGWREPNGTVGLWSYVLDYAPLEDWTHEVD